MKKKANKITIVGSGFVGSATAFALVEEALASTLVLIDQNEDKALAEALDIAHGAAFVKRVEVISGDYAASKDSDIVIIAAGIGPKPNETRLDILRNNIPVFEAIVPQIVSYSPDAILLVVSNPVDILTHLTWKLSGLPKERVIGSGTVLDTSRLQKALGDYFHIDARDIASYIVGEHGDSEVVIWSQTRIAGMSLEDYCALNATHCDIRMRETIAQDVKRAGFEVIDRKGYTNYAIALAVRRIVEAILRDERSVLTVSTLMDGAYGISDVVLANPCVLTRNGVERCILLPLSESEEEQVNQSAMILKTTMQSVMQEEK
ncbi:MAG: L-lactate dehydrogenase [Erysipelotrichaceae bacterium]